MLNASSHYGGLGTGNVVGTNRAPDTAVFRPLQWSVPVEEALTLVVLRLLGEVQDWVPALTLTGTNVEEHGGSDVEEQSV